MQIVLNILVFIAVLITVVLTPSSVISTFVLPRADWEHAWRDFAGWRVHYDRALIPACGLVLVMAPNAPWLNDRATPFHMTSLMILKRMNSPWKAKRSEYQCVI